MKAPILSLIAAGLLLAASGAAAQPAKPKATPPAPAPVKDVRFPSFEQKSLANGLRVVVIEQHEQPLVALRMVLKAGKTFDPAEKAGLAGATAALLTKGTPTRSAQQIAEAIDFVGGNLNAATGIESGFASAEVTSDQLDLGFDLLSDILLRPTFPQDEIERWRRQALSGLQIQQQDPGYLASSAADRLIFPNHPYGNPSDGTPESLKGLTRDDLAAFHRRRYVPNDAILAIVGDVKPADAFARAERAFGGWHAGEAAKLPDVAARSGSGHRIVVIDKPDAVQTEIRLGQVAIAFRDPDLYAERVYNSVLGGTASSRLFDEVRRKRGLSYGAGSYFIEGSQPGWFVASTSTKTESTLEALEVSLDVIRALQKEPVPETELGAAKTYITGGFPLEIETADGIAGKILEAMKFGLGREFVETYNESISKVGAADVQRFAKERTRPDDMVIVLAGNAAAFSEGLKKKYGEFETIPAAEVDFLRADLRKPKSAQPAASASDQAQALELLRKAQEALGGTAFVEQRSQVAKGSGTMTPPGVPQPLPIPSIVTYRVLPDKERTEIQLPMGTMIQAFDGTAGWGSMGSQVQDTTAQSKEEQHYGLDVLRQAGQAGYTARPLPDADVAGKPAKVVEIADGEGHATRFFLDPQTSLVTQVAFESGGETTEAVYTDYREVGGVKVPYQTNVSRNGQPFVQIKYSEVQVNAPVDEGLFKKPAG
ncbi:MAG TPA: pitrilysin family protein [Thermoanaerobaculia bacterium]|nr:pitrilysin family protein [Thermoanaerobaculia bacterium]